MYLTPNKMDSTRQIPLVRCLCVTYVNIAPEPTGFWVENSLYGDINRKVPSGYFILPKKDKCTYLTAALTTNFSINICRI